jgi:hypothetical protein
MSPHHRIQERPTLVTKPPIGYGARYLAQIATRDPQLGHPRTALSWVYLMNGNQSISPKVVGFGLILKDGPESRQSGPVSAIPKKQDCIPSTRHLLRAYRLNHDRNYGLSRNDKRIHEHVFGTRIRTKARQNLVWPWGNQ